MLIIGIDPGISGSICFFEDGKILDVLEMPTMTDGKKNKKQVNGAQIYNEISTKIRGIEKQNLRVIIEQVSAMPCLLFFFPSVIVGISTTSKIFPSSKKHIEPDIPGSIPIISIN